MFDGRYPPLVPSLGTRVERMAPAAIAGDTSPLEARTPPPAPPVTASAPRARKRTGCAPELYDCGRHGKLSVTAIAKLAGITGPGVRARIRRGETGAKLCRHQTQARREGWRIRGCSSWTMVTACRLALAFPHTLPTTREIMAIRPMSRGAATQWRSAMRDARMAIEGTAGDAGEP